MSRSVNGVSKIHTDILKKGVFHDFYMTQPDKFIAITNGITHRRWLMMANYRLSRLIDEAIGGIDTEKAAGRLRQLLESKWKTLADDPQGKLKLIKFALSRGYDYDAVRQSVDDLTS